MSEIIKVEHLRYVYNAGMPDETAALDDVSFSIEKGDFVGVMGSTGSGKSTLIAHFNGLNRPTSGKIIIPLTLSGQYVITEKAAPKWHLLGTEPTKTVSVDYGNTATVTFENAPYGNLRVDKIDADSGASLAGATVEIKHIESGVTQTGTTDLGGSVYFDKLKPGGIMALITSAGTMDKYDDSFRREPSGKADFLGGVRLPEDAFRTAGTQTVTDILFFQKLKFEHENDRDPDWVRSERVYGEASIFQENRYFRQNPEMVLGTPEIVPGRFGNTRTIKSDGNTAERLSEAIGRLDGHFSAEPTIDDELPKEEYGDIPDGVTPYTYYVSGGSLYYAMDAALRHDAPEFILKAQKAIGLAVALAAGIMIVTSLRRPIEALVHIVAKKKY